MIFLKQSINYSATCSRASENGMLGPSATPQDVCIPVNMQQGPVAQNFRNADVWAKLRAGLRLWVFNSFRACMVPTMRIFWTTPHQKPFFFEILTTLIARIESWKSGMSHMVADEELPYNRFVMPIAPPLNAAQHYGFVHMPEGQSSFQCFPQ